MQYPGSPTYWANWWALYIKDWRYEHPDFIKQLDSGWRNFGSALKKCDIKYGPYDKKISYGPHMNFPSTIYEHQKELDFHMRPKATVIYHLQMWDQEEFQINYAFSQSESLL